MSERIITLTFPNGEDHLFAVSEILVDIEEFAHQGRFDFDAFWEHLPLYPGTRRVGDELAQLDQMLAWYRSGDEDFIIFTDTGDDGTDFLCALMSGYFTWANKNRVQQ